MFTYVVFLIESTGDIQYCHEIKGANSMDAENVFHCSPAQVLVQLHGIS